MEWSKSSSVVKYDYDRRLNSEEQLEQVDENLGLCDVMVVITIATEVFRRSVCRYLHFT